MRISLSFLLLGMLFFSCKKSEDGPPDPPVVVEPVLPVAGNLEIAYHETNDGAPPYIGASASFYAVAGRSAPWISAGNIDVNGMDLNESSQHSYWSSFTNDVVPYYNVPCTWTISGSDSIPAFVYTDEQAHPENALIAPQQVSRSADWVLQFPAADYENTDTILVGLGGGSGVFLDRKVLPGGSITFSKGYLDSIQGNRALLWVAANHYKSEVIGGKRFVFARSNHKIIGVPLN